MMGWTVPRPSRRRGQRRRTCDSLLQTTAAASLQHGGVAQGVMSANNYLMMLLTTLLTTTRLPEGDEDVLGAVGDAAPRGRDFADIAADEVPAAQRSPAFGGVEDEFVQIARVAVAAAAVPADNFRL
jgi:hypothetical protein